MNFLLKNGLFLLVFGMSCSTQESKDNSISSDFLALVRSGDIIFQTSKSAQSQAIQLATNSKYSHLGIIVKEGEKMEVFEAIEPVKMTPINDWIRRGKGGKFVVKRLKNAENVLTPNNLALLKQTGKQFVGKHYDSQFGWDDDRIYCSELVWKIFKQALNIEVGHLQKLSDFNLKNQVVAQKLKERYGDKLPMNEPVISPAAMFVSDLLKTVISN